ncbi:MAG: class I SAM-dependent methyltransferase [Candidatus Acidiferrales bacterium]
MTSIANRRKEQTPAPLSVRTTCRACDSQALSPVLSLGEVPLANSYLSADQLHLPEPRFPLEIYFCESCSLLQLRHVVSPDVLFSHYLYMTGTNQTIVKHNQALAAAVSRELGLSAGDLVVEVASNDGSLLACFNKYDVRTLGIEPARNIASIARQRGIETLNEFFDQRTAEQILAEKGPAKAVLANNVLAHVDSTVEFLSACRTILAPDGRVVVEAPYLAEMLERLEYDTIYHEHLCYLSVTPLLRLFERAGLALDRVDRVPIHGGSLRLWAKHLDSSGHSESVRQMAALERDAGFHRIETYLEFARRVQHSRTQLVALLDQIHAQGKIVAAYGAPAKGNTLLCYCGITSDRIPYTVDRSPLKIGLHTPGSHIPILPVETLFERQPDFVLLLAWNFAEEILDFLKPYRDRGGRVILPIPEPRVV